MKNQNPIAEIIESSTKSIIVQCYELYQAPKLGTLIKTQDDPSIIGIVYNVFTEPLDPSRRPIARGPFQNEPRSYTKRIRIYHCFLEHRHKFSF